MASEVGEDEDASAAAVAEEARTLAAAAMRRLGHAMVAHDIDTELLQRIAIQATATAEVVEAGARRVRPILDMKRQLWEAPPPDGGRMRHFHECVVSGQANPMGVAMIVRRVQDRVVADVHLGAAFEGAPRRAHGGIVAAVFDDIMGYVLLVLRTPAFTGQLGVTYLAPTPVEVDLVATAWLERREDRKLWLAATLETADGDLIARGEALFITVPAERFREPKQPLPDSDRAEARSPDPGVTQ